MIVAGETGSGKTTQLPKICLELGRGQSGAVIGHTQPRRIAARSVAERIAEELGTELGDVVGYQVRFTDRSSRSTLVKVMTDGILLAEIQRDRMLRRYDTIIIDEAHERSLNIDFILGYLKQLLPRRPDLKVIITSATIDPQRFSRHFDDAPVIEVSGRMYPVEVRYREIVDDQPTGIVEAVSELMREGPGDILVFLSGEREIRDAADALAGLRPTRVTDALEVLPLYRPALLGRPASGLRAAREPSGRARDERRRDVAHRARHPVRRRHRPGADLAVQRPDQGAAAADRADLAGQRQPAGRPLWPGRRRDLHPALRGGGLPRQAGVHRARDPADQPGGRHPADDGARPRRRGEVPVRRAARHPRGPGGHPAAGGDRRALDGSDRLAAAASPRRGVGRQVAVPEGPARSRSRGSRRSAGSSPSCRSTRGSAGCSWRPRRLGCLREVIVVTAALSMQDPRERPADQQEQADQLHRRFADPDSDFAGILNLWRFLKEQQEELSSSAFRRMCKRSFLNYLRVREWQDLDSQLRQVAKQVGLVLNTSPAAAPAIHQALLAGLLSHIGLRDGERREYQGARGTRFAIFPGSALFKKPPEFVMSAELVETGRLWARVNARLDPAWAEEVGAHLLKRTYSEPHWEKKRGAVMALEKVTLYGVPIVADRPVNFGRIDPEVARDLFIRHALVQGEWRTHHRFLARNQALLRGGRGPREPGPATRHRRRRGDDLRLLRRAGARPGGLHRALRLVVEGGAADPTGPADASPARCCCTSRPRPSPSTTSPPSGSTASRCCRWTTRSSPAASTTASRSTSRSRR